ncbi:MAG: toxin-antitoxin system protein [Proteiniphilum sp.]|jgi:hypothetical protein|nr:toxin-antitoxin system protein [Proteiniphilum sp.]
MKIEVIKKKKQTAFRLNEQLLAKLKKAAKKENRSLSNYVECILYESLERTPNIITRNSMKDAEGGIELEKLNLDSLEDFTKNLD